jgi:hypothetical protein
MLRKTGLAVLYALSLSSTPLFSATEHTFNSMGASYEFTLPPNVPQIFNNVFYWTIEAKCSISSSNESNLFSFTVLRKSGALNNINLSQGDAMVLIVHPGDQLHITAVAGGRVELTNHGEETIKATCSSR